jgi:hypothetical protein
MFVQVTFWQGVWNCGWGRLGSCRVLCGQVRDEMLRQRLPAADQTLASL